MSFAREIEVSELADRQIREADQWWRENRLKAPNAIREELEENPECDRVSTAHR